MWVKTRINAPKNLFDLNPWTFLLGLKPHTDYNTKGAHPDHRSLSWTNTDTCHPMGRSTIDMQKLKIFSKSQVSPNYDKCDKWTVGVSHCCEANGLCTYCNIHTLLQCHYGITTVSLSHEGCLGLWGKKITDNWA